MNNKIKGIRIIVFSIFFVMLMQVVIVECVDNMSVRNILIKIGSVVWVLLVLILKRMPRLANKRVTIVDLLNIVMFIGIVTHLGKTLSSSTTIQTTFQGDNVYVCYWSKDSGDYRYDDIESILEDVIQNEKDTGTYSKLEEIYRIQEGEKIFVYFKEGEEKIVEYDFFRQDDLYYCSGSNGLVYDGLVSSGSYTTEETIRKDIANTMWRGVGRKEVGAPAWGVSTDDRIASMTINAEPVDDVILINEKDGKKYYFWIVTNVGEIKTFDDVKAAEIEMNDFRSQSIKEGIKREDAIEKCMKNEGYFMVRFSDYNTGLMYIISEGNDKGIEVELEGNTPLHSLSNAFRNSKNEFLVYGSEENTEKKATDATLLEDFPKDPYK